MTAQPPRHRSHGHEHGQGHRHGQPGGPFAALGLPPSADVTDEDVRAAWRRVAAATHPDRRDGGDPPRFTAASAAYASLRTRFGRGEVLAGLAGGPDAGRPAAVAPPREAPLARQAAAAPADAPLARTGAAVGAAAGLLTGVLTRVRRGRPAVLTVRVLLVTAAGLGSAALVGWAPATPALITGALTWLLLTARHDLGPRA